MKRRLVFRKLVDGYRAQLKWKTEDKPTLKAISTFPKGPLEIKGEVSIKKGEITVKKGVANAQSKRHYE